ncbi:MAG: UDP-N-acetylmuramoyl-L-alanine--D-glutamate ligase [Ignavibacteria bacterium]|nr:UDP-N-acetylmuramoyl-L-alanine--D-glutamate ligase [Ignavibacteria bacterium]
MTSYKGKKISIIGAARSGEAAAYLAAKLGAVPFVSDSGAPEKTADVTTRLKAAGIEFEAGTNSERVYDCDLMIVSPGVPLESAVVLEGKKRNIRMISEIEFAASVCKGKIYAITGTNGKTTTTSLLHHIFSLSGKKSFSAGNIGIAFSEIALECETDSLVALEVSSFQLDLIEKFKPNGAAILNITPDHLNRYENKFENYIASKYRIVENQTGSDISLYNADDEVLQENGYKGASLRFFSTKKEVDNGTYLSHPRLVTRIGGNFIFSFDINDLQIKGEHNLANAAAAITMAIDAGIDKKVIEQGLKSFKAVEHRLEPVPSNDGIVYINDSKATNVDSVVYALRSFDSPIILILGGLDKGNNYDLIRDLVSKNVKKIYAIGDSASKVYDYFSKIVEVELVGSLEECVQKGHYEAQKGEVVLLSPACASFDMFKSYEHRGEVFKSAVKEIAG